jgi:hypothetical protein
MLLVEEKVIPPPQTRFDSQQTKSEELTGTQKKLNVKAFYQRQLVQIEKTRQMRPQSLRAKPFLQPTR